MDVGARKMKIIVAGGDDVQEGRGMRGRRRFIDRQTRAHRRTAPLRTAKPPTYAVVDGVTRFPHALSPLPSAPVLVLVFVFWLPLRGLRTPRR